MHVACDVQKHLLDAGIVRGRQRHRSLVTHCPEVVMQCGLRQSLEDRRILIVILQTPGG